MSDPNPSLIMLEPPGFLKTCPSTLIQGRGTKKIASKYRWKTILHNPTGGHSIREVGWRLQDFADISYKNPPGNDHIYPPLKKRKIIFEHTQGVGICSQEGSPPVLFTSCSCMSGCPMPLFGACAYLKIYTRSINLKVRQVCLIFFRKYAKHHIISVRN